VKAGDVVAIANSYAARLADVGVTPCDANGLHTRYGVVLRRAPNDTSFYAVTASEATATGEPIVSSLSYFTSGTLWWVLVQDLGSTPGSYMERVYPESDLSTTFSRPKIDITVA
jgi:hypothetical protein